MRNSSNYRPNQRFEIGNRCANRPHPQSMGFTLTELLVVIAIIAVLAALSMMGVRQFKAAADKTVAMRNISQLQLANTSYATDHGGRYVPVDGFDANGNRLWWFLNTELFGYLNGDNATVKSKSNWPTVPLNMLDPIVTKAKKSMYDVYPANFGYNYEGFNYDPSMPPYGSPGHMRAWLMSQTVSPERSCAFITSTCDVATYGGRSLWKGAAAVEGKTGDGKIAYRHKGGKALVAYYDGHVGEITMKEMEQLDTNSEPSMRGSKNIFWNPDGK
jgi:prepilin-type N-terminal cleavage/methylation domain-containing protein/prepilin-type processing-associated H-X9-DG protein